MKFIKKMILLSCICLAFSCETETDSEIEQKVTADLITTLKFDVVIKLIEPRSGQEISASTLPGYAARNLETNEIYYTSQREVDLFESLPTGTYRFDAYDGYFDGASSVIAEVSPAFETEDGWIEVTLNYWSE
ncbi:hypothetical protein GCM10022393_32430 [Aquimarina addita]|uniref:DUF4249 family protein n=1 Tax=Aquimarina addita TaxID=870485 RepID=A0ABP6UT59_9FLAO